MLRSITLSLALALSSDPAPAPAPQPVAPTPAVSPAPIKEDPAVFGRPPAITSASDPNEAPESMGWLLVKMLLGLGVTVGAIYLSLSYVARRLQGFPGARSAVVKVVERVPLEPRRTLWVVEVAGEYLLLSSGDGPMTLLAKLDADKAREAVAQARSSTTAPKPFWLKLLEKRQAPGGK